jgi:hypothetical protein
MLRLGKRLAGVWVQRGEIEDIYENAANRKKAGNLTRIRLRPSYYLRRQLSNTELVTTNRFSQSVKRIMVTHVHQDDLLDLNQQLQLLQDSTS